MGFEINMICLFLLVFVVLPELSSTACKLCDPGFDAKPTVEELSPITLKAEWGGGIINDVECVDHFCALLENKRRKSK